jgi:hypothetical protein
VTAIMTIRTASRLEGYMNGLRVAKLAAMALNQEYGYVRYKQFIDVIEGYEREVRMVIPKETGDAYLRGVQAGLKDAAQTAHRVWQTHNDPKVIADALDSMSRDPGYVSAVSNQNGDAATTRQHRKGG